MENAAKALLIAGGVLIAILLLTIFAYLFGKMAGSTSSIYDTLEASEIAEFNQQFLNYEGRGINPSSTPLTVQDVATLINLAQDNNKNPKFPTTVVIEYEGNNLALNSNYITWLQNNQTSNVTYNCKEVRINTSTLLVEYIKIEEHT